jgi:hypothetical protein
VGVREERRESHLHDDASDGPSIGADLIRELAREPANLPHDLLGVADVPLIGPLLPPSLGDVGIRRHLPGALALGEAPEPRACARPEGRGERLHVGAGEVADGAEPRLGEPPGRLPSDPPQRLGGAPLHHGAPVAPGETEDAAGLPHIRRDLGPELVVADPHRAREARGAEDRALDLGCERLGILCLDLEVGLVPPGDLDDRRERPKRPHDLAGCLVVRLGVDGQEHRLGTAPCRRSQRHPGSDPEPPSLVGGRRDHSAFRGITVAADDDGDVAQIGPAKHLDGRDELVEIDVKDEPAHGTPPYESESAL